MAVQQRHLQFRLVIGDGANPSQNDIGAALAGVVDEQSIERIHFHVAEFRGRFPQHFLALLHAEQRLLLAVSENRDNEMVKQAATARDQIQVPVSRGIK